MNEKTKKTLIIGGAVILALLIIFRQGKADIARAADPQWDGTGVPDIYFPSMDLPPASAGGNITYNAGGGGILYTPGGIQIPSSYLPPRSGAANTIPQVGGPKDHCACKC